jgi:hypothetical protein
MPVLFLFGSDRLATSWPCCDGLRYNPESQCCEDGNIVDKETVYVINRNYDNGIGHTDLAIPGVGLIGFYGVGGTGGSGLGMTGNLNMTFADWTSGSTERNSYVNGPPNSSDINGEVFPSQKSTICEIKVCPRDVESMNIVAEEMYVNPGTFSIVGNNCATHAAQILNAGGVTSGNILGLDTPTGLQSELINNYSANCYSGYTSLDATGTVVTITVD